MWAWPPKVISCVFVGCDGVTACTLFRIRTKTSQSPSSQHGTPHVMRRGNRQRSSCQSIPLQSCFSSSVPISSCRRFLLCLLGSPSSSHTCRENPALPGQVLALSCMFLAAGAEYHIERFLKDREDHLRTFIKLPEDDKLDGTRRAPPQTIHKQALIQLLPRTVADKFRH